VLLAVIQLHRPRAVCLTLRAWLLWVVANLVAAAAVAGSCSYYAGHIPGC
jgi:hypothetical protein